MCDEFVQERGRSPNPSPKWWDACSYGRRKEDRELVVEVLFSGITEPNETPFTPSSLSPSYLLSPSHLPSSSG